MNDAEIKSIINDTANTVVLKMKMAGLIRDGRKTAIEKTEELLRNYPIFKDITDQEYTIKLVAKIEDALKDIEGDIYYDVIPMFYFHNETREYIAERFGCTETTVSRNKTRLLNQLKLKLFSDDVIFELFL
jgi:RNA polymerase sigma factor (sigma-70 family)